MEVISIDANGRGSGKYNEAALLEAIKAALEESKKTKKTAGFHLQAFLAEVYEGESPNLGAVRKKVQEIGWKHHLGDVRTTIREKDDLIGFYINK